MVTALRTLTIIPVPGKDCTPFTDSLICFPFVGALLGAVVVVVAKISMATIPDQPLLAAFLITTAISLISGGLHIDGFADIADGFGGGKDKAQVLAILKDPRHGTFGVMAIVFITIGKVLTTMVVLQSSMYLLLFLYPIVGRTVQAVGCVTLPYARAEGGKAELFVKKQPRLKMLLLTLSILGVIASVCAYNFLIAGSLLSACMAATLFYLYCKRRIGGITGDCIGAANEVAEISFLFSGVVLLNTL